MRSRARDAKRPVNVLGAPAYFPGHGMHGAFLDTEESRLAMRAPSMRG